jgi:uncharacterized protein with ATP-grasp and redox domains
MNTVSDCAVCLLKLAHTSAKAVGAPEPLMLKATRAALDALAKDDFSRVPPAIAREVLDRVCEALGTDDPFSRIKKEHNDKALKLADEWAPGYLDEAADGEDRLARAVRAALIGNSVDMATIPERSDPNNVKEWIDVPWAVHDWERFKTTLNDADDVFYLCDNAGEIAFDLVLIKELLESGKRVTVSVKGGPALNDATVEDASQVGMDKIEGSAGPVEIITTGRADMGVNLETASAEWLDAFNKAGMVIAKGQANLECLHDCGREVFFITLVKCTHVASYYGLSKGSAMLYRGGVESEADKG